MGKIILPNHQNVQYKTRKVKSFPHFFSFVKMNDVSSSNIEFFAVVHQLLFVIFLWIAGTALFNNVFKYFLKEYFMLLMFLRHIKKKLYTWAQNVCPVWPVYEVKCLCSRGQESGRESCHSHQLFNIWFLWHEELNI